MSRVAFCFVFDRFILRNAKDCGRTCLCRLYDHRLTAPPHPANDPREVPWNRSALFNSTRTTRMCQEQLALIHCWTHSMLAFILHALLNYHLLPWRPSRIPISCALDVYSRNSINPILEKLQWTWEGIQKPWVDQNSEAMSYLLKTRKEREPPLQEHAASEEQAKVGRKLCRLRCCAASFWKECITILWWSTT